MTDFSFLASTITAHTKLKALAPWKKSYDKPGQRIKKWEHHFANRGVYSQSYSFPLVMYGCESWTIKKAELQRISACKSWCWRTLQSSLPCKKIKPVHPKRNQPWILIGRTSMSEGVFLMFPQIEIYSTSTYPSTILFSLYLFSYSLNFMGPLILILICITVGHSKSQQCCQSLRSMQWMCRVYYFEIVNVVCYVNFL